MSNQLCMRGVLGAALLTLAPLVTALDRSGTWDVILRTNYFEDTTIDGSNGSEAELDSDFGFGFGLTYNFSSRFSLGAEFDWASIDYDATVPSESGSGDFVYKSELDLTSFQMAATYYFTDGVVQPFAVGLLGGTYYDTNIQDGEASGVCWWDPWWGYYCAVDVPTRDGTEFSYGVGLGLRWNINDQYFMRGQYSRSWLDVGGSAGTPDFDIWRIEFGISM